MCNLNAMANSTDNDLGMSTYNQSDEEHIAYLYDYERQLIASLCVISAAAGAVGNCLVLLAVLRSKKLRTVTNVFVANLSASDLLSSLFLPWQAVALLSDGHWPAPGSEWVCVACSAVLCLSYGSSFNNLTLVALNRWVGITKPRATARRIFNRRSVAVMVVLSWAFPLGLVLIPVLSDFGELGYEPLYGVCGFVRSNAHSVAYCFVFSMCFSPVQFLTLLLCYASVFRYVRRRSRTMARREVRSVSGAVGSCRLERWELRRRLWKRQVAVTKNLVHIVSAFVICQLPFVVAVSRQSRAWGVRMTMYAAAVLFFNSSVNPVIYAVSHPDFKETFKIMFCRK